MRLLIGDVRLNLIFTNRLREELQNIIFFGTGFRSGQNRYRSMLYFPISLTSLLCINPKLFEIFCHGFHTICN